MIWLILNHRGIEMGINGKSFGTLQQMVQFRYLYHRLSNQSYAAQYKIVLQGTSQHLSSTYNTFRRPTGNSLRYPLARSTDATRPPPLSLSVLWLFCGIIHRWTFPAAERDIMEWVLHFPKSETRKYGAGKQVWRTHAPPPKMYMHIQGSAKFQFLGCVFPPLSAGVSSRNLGIKLLPNPVCNARPPRSLRVMINGLICSLWGDKFGRRRSP